MTPGEILATVPANERIAIPARIRRELRIKPGQVFAVEVRDGILVLTPRVGEA